MCRTFRLAVRIGLAVIVAAPACDAAAQTAPPAAETPLSEILPAAPPAERVEPLDLSEYPAVRVAYQEAEDTLASGDPRAALQKLDRADATDDGRFYEVHALRARAAAALGDMDLARRSAERAWHLRPELADAHVMLARLRQNAGETETAIAHYRSATLAGEREPDNPRVTLAWHRLGLLLARQGRWRAATEAYEQFDRMIWLTHPEHRVADEVRPILDMWPRGGVEQRLELQRRRAQREEAVETARWAVTNIPDDPVVHALLVRALLDAGRPDEALEVCLDRRAESAGDKRLPLTLELEARLAAGRLDEWLAGRRIAAEDPALLDRALRDVDRLMQVGAAETALSLCEILERVHPACAEVALAAADVRRHVGPPAAALDGLIRFLRANPGAADVSVVRFQAWLRPDGAADRLADQMERYRRREGHDAAADVGLGLLAAAGRGDMAEALLGSGLEAQPDLLLGHLARGMLALRGHRWADAKAHADAALRQSSGCALAHYIAAVAHDGLDEDDQAQAALKRASALSPRDAGLLLEQGRQARRNGDLLLAQRHLRDALSCDPACGQALEELIEAYLDDRKVEIARTRFERSQLDDVPADVLRRCGLAVRFARGAADDFMAELRLQHDTHPDDVRIGVKLAAALLFSEDFDGAAAILAELPRDGDDGDAVLVMLAQVARQRLDFGAAAAHVQVLAERYPNRRGVHVELAGHLLHDGQSLRARQVLLGLLPKATEENQRRALREGVLQVCYTFAEYAGGLELVETWARAGVSDTELMPWRLRLLVGAGRVGEAAALLATPAPRIQLDAFYSACRDAEQPEAAIEVLRREHAAKPDDFDLARVLLAALATAQRHDEALELARSLPAESHDASNRRRYLVAASQLRAGDLAAGVKECETLLAERFVDEELRYQARLELILALSGAGEVERALSEVREMSADAGPAERVAIETLWLQRAVYEAADRTPDYLRISEEIYRRNPGDPRINNDLGYTWADRGERLDEALRMTRRAVAAEPLNAAYLDSLGWALYKTGDFHAAVEWLRRATRLREGVDGVLLDHLGDALHRVGDAGGAQSAWRRALEVLPRQGRESPRAARRYEEIAMQVRKKLAAVEQGEAPAVAPAAADPR